MEKGRFIYLRRVLPAWMNQRHCLQLWQIDAARRVMAREYYFVTSFVPKLWVAHTWHSLPGVNTVRIHRKRLDVCVTQRNLTK